MGSRLKQNPEQTFYWFFQAACPVARDRDPDVLLQFPEDFSDEDSCQTLPRFCFPYDIQRVRDGVAVQHFTFVLTDLHGCQRFGFCRLTNTTHTCLCILSYLPWFEVFYKLLNNLADYLTKGQINEMKVLLAALYKQPLPLEAGSVSLQMGEQLLVSKEVYHPIGQEGVPFFIAPDSKSLPSIPENRNLTELIVAVDVGNLLQVFASLLLERRILIFSTKLSTLTSCVHALSAVLYPMYWQHIFIPVLPPHLLDYCCAPMPYLIGVHTSLSETVRSRGLDEVVILNVDTNTLETPFDDHKRIPSDVMSGLKLCLKRQAVSPGCGVSRAFLRAQALLFGGYRDALQRHKGDICFSEELFLDHKSHSMRNFLQSAVHLQCFKQFIDGRLDILNKGKEPDDLFEDEILKCETPAGRSKSYQQLVGHLKKGGGALILNMKSKANMRPKGLTKSGLKNLLIHKVHNEDSTLHRVGSVSHRRVQSDCLQNRLPITQHFGMSRPRRPVHKSRPARDQDNVKDTGDTWDGALPVSVDESDGQLQRGGGEEEEEEVEEEYDTLLCDPEEMDLLGEIFDTLSSRSSHDRGLLYGTRSLDLFGPDNHDYITKCGPVNPSQESLFLSISGNGSLHSWNLETTEELSDLTEDSDDWSCLSSVMSSVPEDKGPDSLLATGEKGKQEREQPQDGEKKDEVMVEINGKKEEEKGNNKEMRFEEEKKKEDWEMRVSIGEEPMKETAEKREEVGFKENRRDDERNQSEQVIEEEIERETNKMQKDVARGEDRKEKEDEKEKEVTASSNNILKLNPCDYNTVEEWQGQRETASPQTTAPSLPQSLTTDLKPPAGQEKICEEPAKKGCRQTPSSPKVLSAVACFQSQTSSSQSFQVKSRTKGFPEPGRQCHMLWSRENKLTHQLCQSNISDENKCSETQTEDDPPLIKVSELKKRFEA